MNTIKRIYREREALWCRLVFPLILALYPLVMIRQGIDVSDSTYSLSNFLYFDRMEGMWVISTYVSNLVGRILTLLPLGETLAGMKLYTGLLVSGTVLTAYFFLRKWMPAWIVFVGELIAVGFLWIPTTILYNYLTYFLFCLGSLLLYKGLVEGRDRYLLAAGIALGLNVFVRIPNLTQASLIIGLWYYLASLKQPLSMIVKKTGICIAGYCVGILPPLAGILVSYGMEGLFGAITGLGAIQNTDATYSPLAMVRAVLEAYTRSGKWFFLLGICTGMGMIMFLLARKKLVAVKKALYLTGMLILLRFLWGRGMFSFRYYEDYTSMYEWGMMGLFLAWGAALYLLFSIRTTKEEKLWGCLGLVILAVTPLGSNNYTYQNLNNLFLTAPITLYAFVKLFRYRRGTSSSPVWDLTFAPKAMALLVGAMILVQSMGFHLNFSFRDGMEGSRRYSQTERIPAAAGVRTTQQNAQELEKLYGFLEEEGLLEKEVLLYGDCPGLSFLFQMPFAISTAWPDLDSYSYSAFREELESCAAASKYPVVIVRQLHGENGQRPEKEKFLRGWMEGNDYRRVYSQAGYEVYNR